ncbi:MAG TPA: hypothetical protein PLP01_12765 [Phycisphaerae bacterium]|jgi:hypothetical protein|nr:hypothetical protein [Phycisphaerae bacterium]
MAEGLGRERWAHTSMVCCLIANANRDPKKHRPFKPDDFNPYAERSRRSDVIEVNAETVGLMRAAFIGSPEPQKGC